MKALLDLIDVDAKHLALLGAATATYLGVKQLMPRATLSHRLVEDTAYLCNHPNLTHIISRFSVLDPNEGRVSQLVNVLERLLEASAKAAQMSGTRDAATAAVAVNRLGSHAKCIARDIIHAAKRSRDEEIIRECIHINDDEYHMLESVLDGVLHNAMLDSFKD